MVKAFFIFYFVFLFSSCSENSTSPDNDTSDESQFICKNRSEGTLSRFDLDGNFINSIGEDLELFSSYDISSILKTIVFTARRNDTISIYTSDIDGKNIKRIYNSERSAISLMFKPGGNEILFVIARGDYENFDLFIMDKDGDNQRNIINLRSSHLKYDISPDGKWIVFSAPYEQNSMTAHIFKLNLDNNDLRKLTHGNFNAYAPVFSTNGSKIAYYEGISGKIYLMNSDGTNNNPICSYQLGQGDGMLKFTNEDQKIIFSSIHEGTLRSGIMCYSLQKNLLSIIAPDLNFKEGTFDISSDGRLILFEAGTGLLQDPHVFTGSQYIYSYNFSDSILTKITNDDNEYYNPKFIN